MKKRGQLTIFIIVAILVVAIVAVFFMLSKSGFGLNIGKTQSPENFIQTCLEDSLIENVEMISIQGGSIDPQNYYEYEGEKVQYLCYTNEDLRKCYVQIPFLKEHIEGEIKKSMEREVENCFDSLKETYDGRVQKGEINTKILPKKIILYINNSFTYGKNEDIKRNENFKVIINNNLYELLGIAQDMVEWESNYGEAEADMYMTYFPFLRLNKHYQGDETIIYILEDRNLGTKFQFASKSIPFTQI